MATEKEGSELAGLMRETATAAAGEKAYEDNTGRVGSPGGERIAGASPGRWRRTGLAAGMGWWHRTPAGPASGEM